ncbi:Aldehyde reductase Ahr [Vibrio stylophorae]|uniref:Aldehyde reductase Ahr n=1 Tax=Vibrio stylophorae TaxID=659351 RepID=A0ABM8ZTE2_9VIBR|nr:NAD(P)-dependent alcohol dehydrogenase [Vibrio stylophorae]CAH0533596.1 Aldehyde reductase Ahr [Vibrio stylophorae]
MYQAFSAQECHQPLVCVEKTLPKLQDDEVVISVQYCGICHSDISMIDNEWGISNYPIVAGHEVVGSIEAVGAKVTHLQVGQTVGLGWHSHYCHLCSHCMSGDHNLCSDAHSTIIGRDGGFAEKVMAQASAVIPLPQGMDAQSAGPLFCGGITVFNPMVQFQIKPTDKVAVIGIGGLGHLAIQFLNAWGCEVTAFTSSADKEEEARNFGAQHTINSRDPAQIEQAANQFDYIISTVNVKLDWNLYMTTLKPKGRLHFVGATLEPLDLTVFPMIMGQKSVSASPVGSPANIRKMLEFAHQHQIQPLIEVFPFTEINTALDRVRSGKARYRVVLEW